MHESSAFPGDPASVASARRFVRNALATRGIAADTAELLVSELATNAVLHTGSARGDGFSVLVHVDGVVRVEVVDRSPVLPALRCPDVEDEGGLGLHLVAALADEWGVRHHEDGKAVWFRLGPATGTDPGS